VAPVARSHGAEVGQIFVDVEDMAVAASTAATASAAAPAAATATVLAACGLVSVPPQGAGHPLPRHSLVVERMALGLTQHRLPAEHFALPGQLPGAARSLFE
jgi:hypothetical protein